jgi:urease accessory protein
VNTPRSTRRLASIWTLFALVAMGTSPAAAHVGHGTMGSGNFLDGFLHPVTGLDHLVAMVAVGLWGAQLRAPAIWLLPITFPLVMAVGGFLGLIGVPLPGVDAGVAMSGVVLGVCVATAARPPLWVSAAIVGAFALLHGHAHGTAMPMSGSPIAFGAGFVVATGMLHLCGILVGLLVRWPNGAVIVRASGAVIALVAGYSLFALLGNTG